MTSKGHWDLFEESRFNQNMLNDDMIHIYYSTFLYMTSGITMFTGM